ncbi:nickel/cobalt transporter [Streptomyces sp. NBC_00859]|uniref:nickel/cobalt transporter n=1 Tax=Streptomyces sp. NBC_00859 TaxID=2903682 RepID=UPI003864D25D|nr:high frequency lysogenization protein HflD [Streptomyces sp. NBC_00859]
MTYRRLTWRVAAAVGGVLWLLGVTAPAAQAHPLGNFSVNHYTGFTLHPDHLDVLAVTDTAEIPTLQAAPRVDSNGDGTPSPAERAAWASARCAEAAVGLQVTTPRRLHWKVASATFEYRPGQARLRTSRLECRLKAPLDLTGNPVSLRVQTGADRTRVGWNEITAKGQGVQLKHSSVAQSSSSDELRNYPRDLLQTPRGDFHAQITAVAGSGPSLTAGAGSGAAQDRGLTGRVEALSRHLTSLAGAEHLTVPVGLLAVLLSVILGAGHAMLPGHGKTVMAAYLAGRRGSTRDAITVGATVTITHTAGVLVIGLCLTTFSSLAGDTVLGWLGVISGALVALVGAGLLADAVRRARPTVPSGPMVDAPSPAGPGPVLVGVHGQAEAALTAGLPHAHGHHHTDHHHGPAPEPDHTHVHEPHPAPAHSHPHRGNAHSDRHSHDHAAPHRHGLLGRPHTHAPVNADAQPFSLRGLIGLGIAGGLVPSPSALVVLLGAVALGRTAFGATLVLAYGLGMAATLTAVGLLLVKLGSRAGGLADRPLFALVRRLAPHMAILTALLVLIVGLGLMVRSLPPVL